MVDDLYTIKYYMDEVRMHPSKCLNPENCNCKKTEQSLETGIELRCNMTAYQARQFLIQHYRERADYLDKITIEEFLHDQGIYS